MTQRRRQPIRRGFFGTDAIVALLVVAALATALAVAANRYERTQQKLADAREATRLAEATLTALQSGATPPPPPTGARVVVTKDPTPATVANCAWATVAVTLNGRTTELTGLTRADPAARAAATGPAASTQPAGGAP